MSVKESGPIPCEHSESFQHVGQAACLRIPFARNFLKKYPAKFTASATTELVNDCCVQEE